ncbi:hypothetical protein ACWCQQ_02055 [Streptomyces sp. NPDC002143]
MGPQEREELFERANSLAENRKTWADADLLWSRVITAYEASIEAADRIDRHDERQLARALWRQASLRSVLGRAEDALATGRAAVDVFTRIHDAVSAEHADPTAPLRDRALGELLTAKADLAGFTFNAGRPDLYVDLLTETAALGVGQVRNPVTAGPCTREIMAIVYQRLATALLDRRLDRGDVIEASLMASLAVEIRLGALDAAKPRSPMDLAAVYVVFARALTAMGDHVRLGMLVSQAESLMEFIGEPAADLRAQLRSIVGPSDIPPLPDIMPRRMVYDPPPRRRWWRRGR